MNIQTITLDISKRPSVTPAIYLRQGDKSGTQLRVNVMRDGAAFPLGGYVVRFEMRAPKDRGYYECTGSANGNVATFTIDETYAAAFAGVTDVAYVRILEGSTVIASTGNFRVVIHEDGTEGADPNGAYTNGVTEWLEDATEQLNDVSGRAEAAIEAIGDISELAVPLMSTGVRGGAKLGHGLRITAGALGVQLVDGASGEASVSADGDYLHALAVHGKSVQDGTPTPDAPVDVQMVKDRNLLEPTNVGLYRATNGTLVNDSNNVTSYVARVSRNTDYVVSYNGGNRSNVVGTGGIVPSAGVVGNYIRNVQTQVNPFTFNSGENDYILVQLGYNSDTPISEQQLELGTTATPYVPYGSIGIVTGDTVTPIDLQGNVLASLPDGTHDRLLVDSAGHVVLEKHVGYTDMGTLTWNYNSNWNGHPAFYTQSLRGNIVNYQQPQSVAPIMCSVLEVKSRNDVNASGDNAICLYGKDISLRYGGISSAAEFTTAVSGQYLLYPLATPQTIDLGYIDMPKLSEGSTIELLATIDPPIDAEWWAVGAGAVHESNVAWGARVDAAVAELAEAIADL